MIRNESYFSKSFNEQMTWIAEEVENIIRYDYKDVIKTQGKTLYGKTNYTSTIKRLFDMVRTDPKNKQVVDEVNKAEQELIAFLYDERGVLSQEDIFTYWNEYMWKYIEKLNLHDKKQ